MAGSRVWVGEDSVKTQGKGKGHGYKEGWRTGTISAIHCITHKDYSNHNFIITLGLMWEHNFWFYFYDLVYKAPILWSLLMPIFSLDVLGQSERNQKCRKCWSLKKGSSQLLKVSHYIHYVISAEHRLLSFCRTLKPREAPKPVTQSFHSQSHSPVYSVRCILPELFHGSPWSLPLPTRIITFINNLLLEMHCCHNLPWKVCSHFEFSFLSLLIICT